MIRFQPRLRPARSHGPVRRPLRHGRNRALRHGVHELGCKIQKVSMERSSLIDPVVWFQSRRISYDRGDDDDADRQQEPTSFFRGCGFHKMIQPVEHQQYGGKDAPAEDQPDGDGKQTVALRNIHGCAQRIEVRRLKWAFTETEGICIGRGDHHKESGGEKDGGQHFPYENIQKQNRRCHQ